MSAEVDTGVFLSRRFIRLLSSWSFTLKSKIASQFDLKTV